MPTRAELNADPSDRKFRNSSNTSARTYSVGEPSSGRGGGDVITPYLENRKIDPRLGRATPLAGNISRGRIEAVDSKNRRTGLLHFLFNPTSIQFNYSIDPEALPQELQEYTGTPNIVSAVTCSFALLFDRTYEKLSDPDGSQGVLDDVRVLEHILGMYNAKDGVTSQPAPKPINIFFGGDKAFSFLGQFLSASSEMTHFSPEMVPTRMAVNLSFRRYGDTKESTSRTGTNPGSYSESSNRSAARARSNGGAYHVPT